MDRCCVVTCDETRAHRHDFVTFDARVRDDLIQSRADHAPPVATLPTNPDAVLLTKCCACAIYVSSAALQAERQRHAARPRDGRFGAHDSCSDGNKRNMDLRFSPIEGIVEVMDDQHQHERSVSLGSALSRLSEARERRGSVGVLDPFDALPAEDRLAAAAPVRTARRRHGLFSFSERARDAAEDA